MRDYGWFALVAAALVSGVGAAPSSAQENPMLVHVGHVADAFSATPDGRGLLPVAREEAEIALTHAELAARNSTDLESMKTHAGHVLHAVDPTLVPQGPGLGYGVRRAAEEAARHIDLVQDAEGATWAVLAYARRVEDSAENTVERAERIAELAQAVQQAESVSEAQPHVRELAELSRILIQGIDANNDGGVGARRGEGGLEQARQNLEVLERRVLELTAP